MRKIVKKILVTALAVAMSVSILPCNNTIVSQAAQDNVYENLHYTMFNGSVTITDCEYDAQSVNIPDCINGYPVTTISSGRLMVART